MNMGIYLHIPFCEARCNYCHFVTRPWKPDAAERYRDALLSEIGIFREKMTAVHDTDTVYFGGGTPSLVPAAHITQILENLGSTFRIAEKAEISLEANPGSVSSNKAEQYRRAGINRVSLGAQSFHDQELAAIGRDHSGADIGSSMRLLREKGIHNVNLDLMLGLPWQSEFKWRENLEQVVQLEPSHISIYMLDLDEKSPLFHEISKGRVETPDENLISDLYLATIEFLEGEGYSQYEISNFARPGFESVHNLKYWKCEPVLGFGVGSHSYDGGARYANYAQMAAYLGAVEQGQAPVEWTLPLQPSQKFEEILFLGLRLSRGLDWNLLGQAYGKEQLRRHEQALRDLTGKGLLEWQGSVVRLTKAGILLSNEVFQEFV